jgi:hypothetical protein
LLALAAALTVYGGGATAASRAGGDGPTSMPLISPPGGVAWWAKAAAAPAYTKASAGEPMFDDKALWPQLTGKEKYTAQKWPKARVLTWANPGQSGRYHPRRMGLDPCDAKNWLEDGKPCQKFVLDENTDLVFPASDTPYSVGFRSSPLKEVCRHLTIEKGAEFVGGGDGAGRTIYGNVWVKKGGIIGAQGSTSFVGDAHTFFRNDNYDAGCSQYFSFNKTQADITMEFLGYAGTADEWKLTRGVVIIGPDSVMQPGRAATPFIRPEGTLVLLDGAYWGKSCNEFASSLDLVVTGGTVQAGLSDRPLTRDATLALSFRNWANLDFSKWPNDRLKVRNVSATFAGGASLKVLPAAGAKAHLVITRYDIDKHRGRGGYFHGIGTWWATDAKNKGLFGNDEFMTLFKSKPFKTAIFLGKDTKIEGPVMFDEFAPGTILYQDAATKAAWKDISFGPGNIGPGEALFKQVDKVGNDGSY